MPAAAAAAAAAAGHHAERLHRRVPVVPVGQQGHAQRGGENGHAAQVEGRRVAHRSQQHVSRHRQRDGGRQGERGDQRRREKTGPGER